MIYRLEKNIWTDADFDQMGWHDSYIYKMRLSKDLELDIDYILKWNKPDMEGLFFTFWVEPATLVFKLPTALSFEFDTAFNDALEIEGIEREMLGNTTRWTIITHQGDFEFLSPGYTQFIRQQPFFKFAQTIEYDERYGSSLEQTINQENPNRFRDDIVARRNKELEDYEHVKKRHLKRKEKEDLIKEREQGNIDLKTYLTKKREIKEMLDYYDYWLKYTRFA